MEYAKKVAKAETLDFEQGIYKKKITDKKYYEGDYDLMKKHHRFLSYIYSTLERYMVHRNIILYYYEGLPCTSASLRETLDVSRTSLKEIIQDSIDENWLQKEKNLLNKREFLITPTSLRKKFWLIYCKRRYDKTKSVGLGYAILALEKYEKG